RPHEAEAAVKAPTSRHRRRLGIVRVHGGMMHTGCLVGLSWGALQLRAFHSGPVLAVGGCRPIGTAVAGRMMPWLTARPAGCWTRRAMLVRKTSTPDMLPATT